MLHSQFSFLSLFFSSPESSASRSNILFIYLFIYFTVIVVVVIVVRLTLSLSVIGPFSKILQTMHVTGYTIRSFIVTGLTGLTGELETAGEAFSSIPIKEKQAL